MPTAASMGSDFGGVSPMLMPVQVPLPEAFARDAIIGWFRGEFAAANAIIDGLCSHLIQVECGGGNVRESEYKSLFDAIHQRRMNWIPILQMQKFHSIADVAIELKKVTAKKLGSREENTSSEIRIDESEKTQLEEVRICLEEKEKKIDEKVVENLESNCVETVEEEDSPVSEITDGGSFETHTSAENVEICFNHEECEARATQIKLTKGFVAKESMKGRMVNVVRGLKLYEDIFTDSEFSKLTDFINELRLAGQNGDLSGETFKIFNQHMKGNKRELVQFGVPIFGHVKEEIPTKQENNNIEAIPPLLQNVIDHLVQWRLIPNRQPNSCVINFFDEGEYSQPFLKPPHVDQPISTLVLSESTMAFGCTLVSDNDGNYKAPQILALKQGSLLVMRGNSADTAAHVMCPSKTKRATITFFRVRPETPTQNMDRAMTIWQPYAMQNGALNSGSPTMDMMMPKWGSLGAPMVMLTAPLRPMLPSDPTRLERGGTGVFLPWTVTSKRHTRHLPPRAKKGRLLALTSHVEKHGLDATSDSGITV